MQTDLEYRTKESSRESIDDDPEPYSGTVCIEMPTALAHIFSDDGLVIAADGFNYLKSDQGITLESDRVQKIYPVSGAERAVACAFFGRVTLWNNADERVFSFVSTCQKAAKAIESLPARDANEFAALLCPLILEDLSSVKRTGHLDRYPSPTQRRIGELGRTLVRIFVDGYFNGEPYRSGIRIYHVDQKLCWESRGHELAPWQKNHLYGSRKVEDCLLNGEDFRLKAYKTEAFRLAMTANREPDASIPLTTAIEAARNFIEACSDPIAMEITGEPYPRIGGELHLATITPTEGFQWKIRPAQFDPL